MPALRSAAGPCEPQRQQKRHGGDGFPVGAARSRSRV